MKRTLILIHLALSIAFIGNSISMKAQTKDTIQTSCVLRYYASLEDIKNLKAKESSGIVGAIIGKALYEGVLDLSEVLKIAE